MSDPARTVQTATDLKPFREYASLAEGCSELGALLGLAGPVSEEVFLGAMQDPVYARNLIISRSALTSRRTVSQKRERPLPKPGCSRRVRRRRRSFGPRRSR